MAQRKMASLGRSGGTPAGRLSCVKLSAFIVSLMKSISTTWKEWTIRTPIGGSTPSQWRNGRNVHHAAWEREVLHRLRVNTANCDRLHQVHLVQVRREDCTSRSTQTIRHEQNLRTNTDENLIYREKQELSNRMMTLEKLCVGKTGSKSQPNNVLDE